MNISITGNLGSGKSSVCKILKSNGFEIISAGILFRDIAKEKGMDVNELNEWINQNLANDQSVDYLIDERSKRLGKELDHTVFDSRLAWHFIPQSLKVFLSVDTDVAANRIFLDNTRDTEKYNSVQECKAHLIERKEKESERFKNLYGIDYFNPTNYDLIIDTTQLTPQEVADQILKAYQEKKSKNTN